MVENQPVTQKTKVQSLAWEDSLQKEMATHSNILAWEVPWTEGPGELHSMGLQRIRYDLVNKQQQEFLKYFLGGNSLAVQWLRFGAFTASGLETKILQDLLA